MPRNLWSDTEIQILREEYPKTIPKEIMELLPKRSYFGIQLKASDLGVKKLPETLSRVRAVFLGRRHTIETKARISKARKGKKMPEEYRQRLSMTMIGEGNPFYGRRHTERTKLMLSESRRGKRNSPNTEFTSEGMKKICQDPQEKKRRSLRSKCLWQSKEYAEKTLSAILKSLARRPNKLETRAIELLGKNFPNEWEYTGNGKVILGKLIPDFINVNGKKKVIEIFGEYWHTGERTKNRINLTERGRIKEYQKLGFGCLVLWDRDLEDEEKAIRLVKSFMEV